MPAEAVIMVPESPRPARQSPDAPSGVLLTDKPAGITSHDVVDRVRRLYRTRRVGHTGTLDPIASGLMLVLVGRATKIAPYITALSKRYLATVRFGATSDTGDATGKLTATGDSTPITAEQIRETLATFVGETAQRIPAYSAVRSGGRRLYELARKGEDVPELERTVSIHSAELVSYEGDTADIRVACSSGTYIRSFAEALGESLGCGAHLSGLRREAVGRWNVEDAWTLETLDEMKREGELPSPNPIAEYLDYARINIEAEALESVVHGTPLTPNDITSIEGQFTPGDIVLVVYSVQQVCALATALVDSNNRPNWPPNQPVLSYRRVLAQ